MSRADVGLSRIPTITIEVHEARSEGGDEDQAEQDLRDGHRDIRGAHQHLVEQRQTQRSRKPPGDAEHHAERSRAEGDPERDPPSVQHAREQIPAELVGPEPVVPARRAEGVDRIDGVRPVRRQERRRDDGEHDHGQDGDRDDGTRLPAQPETATARLGEPGGDHRVAHAADLVSSLCRGSSAAYRTSTTSEVTMNAALTRTTTLCRML